MWSSFVLLTLGTTNLLRELKWNWPPCSSSHIATTKWITKSVDLHWYLIMPNSIIMRHAPEHTLIVIDWRKRCSRLILMLRATKTSQLNKSKMSLKQVGFVKEYCFFKIHQFWLWISVAAMDHSDHDCLMTVVLSHGELVPLKDRKGKPFTTILTHDLFSYLHATDNKYPLQTIWEQFTDERCPTLKNKPRIFLISACQGDGIDEGLDVEDGYHSSVYQSPSRRLERDITNPFASAKHCAYDKLKLDRSKTLPQKDFIVVYSSVSGFYSYRDTEKGTWFIDALCSVLDDSRGNIDLFNVLTMINREVALEYESTTAGRHKQIPCIVSMLTKLIQFKKNEPLKNGHIKTST